jgi:hypothetical protein
MSPTESALQQLDFFCSDDVYCKVGFSYNGTFIVVMFLARSPTRFVWFVGKPFFYNSRWFWQHGFLQDVMAPGLYH